MGTTDGSEEKWSNNQGNAGALADSEMDFLWLRAPPIVKAHAIVATRFLKSPGRYDYYSPDEISWASISKLPPDLPPSYMRRGDFSGRKMGFYCYCCYFILFFLEGGEGLLFLVFYPRINSPLGKRSEMWVSKKCAILDTKESHFGEIVAVEDNGATSIVCVEICICMRD